jgi:hypothetical protein
MEHLALWEEMPEGGSATWLEHVADEDYQAPAGPEAV